MIRLLLAASALVALFLIPARADLDLEVPVGTALDWDKELHQPTPIIKTGVPGRKAAEAPKAAKGKDVTQIQAPTIRPTPPPAMNFSIPNLYNFFRITTSDIMNHVTPNPGNMNPAPISPPEEPGEPPVIPTGGTPAAKEREPAPNVRMQHGVQGFYPPKIPGELAWLALAAGLRAELHPETTNRHELTAYALEIGEPSFGNAEKLVRGLISDVEPGLPSFPGMRDPIDRMLVKIVVLELVSGYPLGMDPTYAKKTTMMGELAREPIIACANSSHMFLSRNAVTLLANIPGPESAKALRKIFEQTPDLCKKIRCAAGFARKRDKEAVRLLKAATLNSHNALRAMAIYALGAIAAEDAPLAQWLLGQCSAVDEDLKWTILSAVARMHAQSPAVASSAASIKDSFARYRDVGFPKTSAAGSQGGMRAVVIDPPGSKGRILYDTALLAAAASGHAASRNEALSKGGIDSFHPQARILAAEVLPHLGDQGITIAKGLATYSEQSVAVAAVKAVGENPDSVEWLKQTAQSGPPIIRAAALTRLFMHDTKALTEVAQGIVAGGFSGNDGAQAFLIGLALQMLDRLHANKGEDVLRIVQAAAGANAVARRIATDEYDVTKAKIDIFPPFLELAVLALGTTGYEPGLETLLQLLKESPVRAEAAFALGSYGGAKTMSRAAEGLIQALVDPRDGFVRFAAYLSLKHLTGQDHSADYVFGTTPEIWTQALKYRDWLVEYRAKYGDRK